MQYVQYGPLANTWDRMNENKFDIICENIPKRIKQAFEEEYNKYKEAPINAKPQLLPTNVIFYLQTYPVCFQEIAKAFSNNTKNFTETYQRTILYLYADMVIIHLKLCTDSAEYEKASANTKELLKKIEVLSSYQRGLKTMVI